MTNSIDKKFKKEKNKMKDKDENNKSLWKHREEKIERTKLENNVI